MGASFLVKVIGQLAGDSGDLKELRVLNRVLRWTEAEILLEAHPRHQEILTAVEPGCAVFTPGVKEQLGELAETLLSAEGTGVSRSEAARCSYLGLDRPDVAFAAKELCRCMSAPDKASRLALQRPVRYLKGSPRLVYSYPWQLESALDVFCGHRLRRMRGNKAKHIGWCGPTRRRLDQALVVHATSRHFELRRRRILRLGQGHH